MVAQVHIRCVGSRRQVVIAEELLTASHPVTEDHEQDRGCLKAIEYVLAEALIVHGWHTVAIVQHQLLLEVENHAGEAGNREENRHT